MGVPLTPGVEGDHLDRLGAAVGAVMPLVDDFDHRMAGRDLKNFSFLGRDGEVAL